MPEAVSAPVIDGGAPAANVQSEAQPDAKPLDQETVDLTSLGFNAKLPKSVVEKIAKYDPETIEYLGKADLKDRQAYEKSFEAWNKGQAQKVSEVERSRSSYEKKAKEAEASIREYTEKMQQLDRIWGEKAWESELTPDAKKSIGGLNQLLGDGTITQEQYDAMVKPIVDGVKSSMVARQDALERQREAALAEIKASAEELAPKYGFTSEIASLLLKGLCSGMDLPPKAAMGMFESEIDRVINLRLIQPRKPEPTSPDTKTPPSTPVRIETPGDKPSKEAKANFIGAAFRGLTGK